MILSCAAFISIVSALNLNFIFKLWFLKFWFQAREIKLGAISFDSGLLML